MREDSRRQQDRASLQHQAEHTRPRRRSAALGGYLVVLFAAAFLLLLMAYFQQQRLNDQAASDALKQSASAVDSIQQLLDQNKTLNEENEVLKEQVDQLTDQLQEAQAQLDVLPDVISHQEYTLEQTKAAMDWFWQIDEAYVRGRYTLCRELIKTMEDISNGQTPLKDYLPTESATDNGRFSPAGRYQEIHDALY